MKKYTLAALFLVASMSVVSAANGAELSLPVNIESVGKLKYMAVKSTDTLIIERITGFIH